MAVNGKQKGAKFERDVAKAFATWTGDVVKRTPASGGWAKGDDFGVAGDLVFVEVDTLHIECKKWKTWALEDFLVGVADDKIPTWWAQCFDECPKGRTPILVMARNMFPALALFPVRVGWGEDPNIRPRGGDTGKLGRRATIVGCFRGQTLMVMALEQFLKRFYLKRRKRG